MAASIRPPRSDQPSIKYRWNPVKGASFELADFVHQEYAPAVSDNIKQSCRESEHNASEILSTADLISAVCQLWNYASCPLAVFHPKANSNNNDSGCQKQGILGNLGTKENGLAPTSDDSKFYCVDSRTASHFLPMVQPNLEHLKVIQKMSVLKPWNEDNTHLFFWRFLQGGSNTPYESWKGKGFTSIGISYELGNMYGWMNEINPTRLKNPVNIEIGNNKTDECCTQGDAVGSARSCISEDTTRSADSYSDSVKSNDSLSCDSEKSVINMRVTDSLYSDYFLANVQDTGGNTTVLSTLTSSLYADYHLNLLAPCNGAFEESLHRNDGEKLPDNKRKEPERHAVELVPETEISSAECDKPQYALAKQEHAFAGALAGICVSLCLHPIDTIKTVIQSCRADQRSICYIGRTIVSERGLTGLYRGITSNIASSAPISAVYTFTYESVKGALLPLFPKDYHSFAHCLAGGCASIATSFIFTPSERIKQQMQVGSHYQNCWNALIGIIGKGGLPSLYAGWGAVLCRNVPHSIIKFYTYESLKQLMLSSLLYNAQANTLQTLICGGLAGSTAALFTTPFDVVKTRLQTQIPGSVSRYSSVFHALQEIQKHEGLKGLYRGLAPRLVMYMSQGAIFFASYEFFKHVFSLEVPHLNDQKIQYKQNVEDDSMTPVSASSSAQPSSSLSRPPPPPPPRLHGLHS